MKQSVYTYIVILGNIHNKNIKMIVWNGEQ